MFTKTTKRAAVFALLGVMTACADLGPTGPSFQEDLPLAGATDLEFKDGRLALTWLEPLEDATSITKTIGLWGGTIELASPGLRLWVPPFALEENLEITMSARPGEDVAFDFGPHGTNFRHDVWVSIDLTKVLNGKSLIDELRSCAQPEDGPGTVGSSDVTWGLAAAQASNKKKGKKKKKKKSDDDDNGDGNDDDTSEDAAPDAGSTSTASTGATNTNNTSTNNTTSYECEFSWFEKLEGLDGVYMDPAVADAVAHALEDFEVWVFMDRWLSFKTDHFSGYALAM